MLYSFTSFTITLPNKRKAGSSKWNPNWLGYLTIVMNSLPYQVSMLDNLDVNTRYSKGHITIVRSSSDWARTHGVHCDLSNNELSAIRTFIEKFHDRIKFLLTLQQFTYNTTFRELKKEYPFRKEVIVSI